MSKSSITRRSFVAAGAVAAAAMGLGLSSCGGNKSNTSGSSSSSSGTVEGGTLKGACAYSSTSYSPIGNSSALMLAATWHVFEGLYEIDLTDYSTYNALAAGDPTKVSDTEYTVKLRDGAKFSDGKSVTAADVVNAFQKNMANDTYSAFLEFIDTVSAKDDTTIDFKLKYAFDSLLKERLACVKVFPADSTEDQLKTKPVGTGPWMYDSINGDDMGKITFSTNSNYNGSKKATASNMEWSVLKSDETARTTALQEGTVQVMEAVPDANVDQLVAAGATCDYMQGFNQPFLMFNCLKAPFNDKRVRQAFFYAINVDKLIKNQMAGKAAAITSFLPENHTNYHKASTVYTYDVEKAKSLLKEAGAEGLSFTLTCNNNWCQSLSAQIKEDLEAAGMKCTLDVKTVPWAEWAPSDSVLPFDVCLTPGDPTCFGNDPDLLMSWWYGDNVWTKGRTCWQKATDGKWTELNGYMQQARTSSGSAQQELWNKCFDLLAEEVPLYALFHRQLCTGYLPEKIANFKPISTTGLVFLGASCTSKS